MLTILSKFYSKRESRGDVRLCDGWKKYLRDQKLGHGKQERFAVEISINTGDK